MNLRTIWRPATYHGHNASPIFFEGWYFKLVDAARSHRWAVIPGIFKHHDPGQSHAFIQVLDGMTGRSTFNRFPAKAFRAARDRFDVTIAGNRFRTDSITLNLSDTPQPLAGELEFTGIKPWPVRLLSPGAMGWYAFAPFMQCYHGVLSFDHHIAGTLTIDDDNVDFTGGRGYIEKDWGQAFPRAYIWMQSNHFGVTGTSLSASVATIPWLNGWFPGFIVGLRIDDTLYRFTTYRGAEIAYLHLSDTHVNWHLTGHERIRSGGIMPGYPRYRLEISAERAKGGMLHAPEETGMVERIVESLTATIDLRLLGLRKEVERILFEGRGLCAGLEVAGSVSEILEQYA